MHVQQNKKLLYTLQYVRDYLALFTCIPSPYKLCVRTYNSIKSGSWFCTRNKCKLGILFRPQTVKFELLGFSSLAHMKVGATHLSGQEDGADKWVSLQVEHQDLGWTDGWVVLEGGDDATVHHPQPVAPVYSNPVGWHQACAVSCSRLPLQARIWL